jgi:glutamate carboxypeptidase
MLDMIAPLIETESPSRNREALAAVRTLTTMLFRAYGGAVATPTEEPASGGALGFTVNLGAPPDVAPVLVISHLDTVWPIGSLAKRPFRIEKGFAYGPGIFDTKASIVLLAFALEALAHEGVVAPRPIRGFLSVDEEVGSPASKKRVIELARGARAALVLEPALGPEGSLKTSRKGVGRFKVTVRGKSAHAGLDPEAGASAIHELAFQVTRLHAMADLARGTTVNVGKLEGGVGANVIAAEASALIDARAFAPEEAERIERAIHGLAPALPGTRIEVEGGFDRPPLLRSDAVVACFELARGIARDLGFTLGEGSVGGGSDGCHTAPLVPTLDGLGAVGAGAHAEDERIDVSWLPRRAALLAALLVSFP